MPCAIIFCLLLISATAVCMDNRHNITLVVMAPFPDELTIGWKRGPALYPAAVIAAREVNNSTDILPEFNLRLIKVDSGCSVVSKVTLSFLRDIFENKDDQVVGIIGPGCSGAALRVANLTARKQVSLIHVTPSATSPELEDPRKNTTYATVSSALSYVQSFIQLMTNNTWNKVATLQDEERLYFKQTHSEFKRAVERAVGSAKVVFTASLFKGKESFLPLESLRSSQARVVMVFAGQDIAAQLLCYAFHKGMLYPSYQWVFHDRTGEQLIQKVGRFRVSGNDITCTREQMVKATEGVILNQFHLEQEHKNITLPLFQKTYNDYYKEYEEELDNNKYGDKTTTNYSNSYHDAVWAMAMALHNASTNGVDLTTYTYNRDNDTKKIAHYLSLVNFKGMSGPIAFQNDTRSVKTIIDIKQLWPSPCNCDETYDEVLIGTFDRSRCPSLNFIEQRKRFINDVYEERHDKVHLSLGILLIFLTAVLIVVMFLLQLANTFWYNYRSIKATSPNITHLIFSGCYLFSIALLILSVQNTFVFSEDIVYAVLCNLFTWCFLIGYSLIFGTICAKIWRVYRLFKHFGNDRPGHFLSDNSLIVFVIMLLCVDVIICTTWNFVDPWITIVTREPSLRGTPILFVRSECTCEHVTLWVIAITLYKGTLTLLLVALSILNRRIKRKDFQHTRKINILIYAVTMLAGVGIPLYFLLKHRSVYIGYTIICVILFATVLLSILTLFLPPVLPVLKAKLTRTEPVQRKNNTNED